MSKEDFRVGDLVIDTCCEENNCQFDQDIFGIVVKIENVSNKIIMCLWFHSAEILETFVGDTSVIRKLEQQNDSH